MGLFDGLFSRPRNKPELIVHDNGVMQEFQREADRLHEALLVGSGNIRLAPFGDNERDRYVVLRMDSVLLLIERAGAEIELRKVTEGE